MAPPLNNDWTGERTTQELSGSHVTVVAVFRDDPAAQRGLEALRGAGFGRDTVSLVTTGTEAGEEIPSQAASEQAAGAAAQGAAIGGVAGGVLAGLVGAGLLAIPGAGPLLAAGWLASAAGGMLAGGAAGGWIGATTQIGVPEDVAKRYQDLVSQGNRLVMVLAEKGNGERLATDVLTRAGAGDVHSYPYLAQPGGTPGARSSVVEHSAEDLPGEV